MVETEHTGLVRAVADAVAAGGPMAMLDRYDEWFGSDFEWHPILLVSVDGRAYRGEAGFRQYWEQFLDAFPDVAFAPAARIEAVDDRRVLVEASITGQGAGSGLPIDRETAYVFEVENGLIVSGRSFFSPADAREYLANA